MLDLALAVIHHLAVFALLGVLVAELVLVRNGMGSATVAQVARVDLSYGALAGVILLVGFARAAFAAKGWSYYADNLFFWAKISVFLLIGLLSLPPTLQYLRWRREARTPQPAEVSRVRGLLLAQLALFALLPIFAAAMARGLGLRAS